MIRHCRSYTDDWSYFEAAYVFPLEKEDYWNEKGYTNLITDVGGTIRDTKINSVQNGLLIWSVYYPSQGFVTNILLYRAILKSLFIVLIPLDWIGVPQ